MHSVGYNMVVTPVRYIANRTAGHTSHSTTPITHQDARRPMVDNTAVQQPSERDPLMPIEKDPLITTTTDEEEERLRLQEEIKATVDSEKQRIKLIDEALVKAAEEERLRQVLQAKIETERQLEEDRYRLIEQVEAAENIRLMRIEKHRIEAEEERLHLIELAKVEADNRAKVVKQRLLEKVRIDEANKAEEAAQKALRLKERIRILSKHKPV